MWSDRTRCRWAGLGLHWRVTTDPGPPSFSQSGVSGAPSGLLQGFFEWTQSHLYELWTHKLPQFYSNKKAFCSYGGRLEWGRRGGHLYPPFVAQRRLRVAGFTGVLSSAVDVWMVYWAVERKKKERGRESERERERESFPGKASPPSVSLTAHSPGGESAALWMKGAAAEGQETNFTNIYFRRGGRSHIQQQRFRGTQQATPGRRAPTTNTQ